MTLYLHSWQYLGRGWLYRENIFLLPTIFGEGVIISLHYFFTSDNIGEGCDYIVTLCFYSWQYLGGGDYIVALYFHSWQYLGGGDYIVALYFHSRQYLVRGLIISWHYIFTPDNNWGGGDHIVTLYFDSRQLSGRGWLFRDVIFSLPTIFGEGVIISWRYIFTPDNIWGGGDYIMPLYFHSWQYLVRGWLYRDIIFSVPTIFWEGWLYRDIIFLLPIIFGEGVIISWHYIFTPIESGTGMIIFEYLHSPQLTLQGDEDTKLFYSIYSYSTHSTYTQACYPLCCWNLVFQYSWIGLGIVSTQFGMNKKP